ncbi:hypothetical protein BDR05DRAFT_73878 [Suillus weaverae]|nr:hypothetical protein BDR05DRAFT_73878 [Suillus weaverae]
MACSYKLGTLEPLRRTSLAPRIGHIPAIPFCHKVMGQHLLDVNLRRRMERFSCSAEMGTELRSFE